MRHPTKLAVVPEAAPDPILECRARVARLTEERIVAADKVTAARIEQKKAEDAFDRGELDVMDKAMTTERLQSAERIYTRAEDTEQAERVALSQLENAKRKVEYDGAIARSQDWLVRLKPTVDALVALDAQQAKLIDDALDVIVAAQHDFDDAERLEREVRPLFTMAANGVRRVELKDARYVARVAVALARRKAGIEIPGQWLESEREPKEGERGYDEFRKVKALLEGGQS
jgi:hypothetical protein